MRIALAVFMLLHGVAHLPGFAVPWKLAKSPDMPYHTTILAGWVDVGDAGIRLFGLTFLLLTVAFALSAGATFLRAEWWLEMAIATVVVSTLVCVLALPEARIGLAANLLILALLVWAHRAGWVRPA